MIFLPFIPIVANAAAPATTCSVETAVANATAQQSRCHKPACITAQMPIDLTSLLPTQQLLLPHHVPQQTAC